MNLQGKKINAMGDSITEGWGLASKEDSFQNVLGRMLGAAEVRSYGYGGTRLAKQIHGHDFGGAMPIRYVNMDDDADLILVMGGTNDYGHGDAPFGSWGDRSPDTFIGGCHTLFSGLIEKYPTACIVIMTPLQRSGGSQPSGNTGKPLIDYADAIIRVAAEYSLPVLDMYRASGICPEIPVQKELFIPDGIHPNEAGHRRMAERIAAFVTAL